MQDLWQQLCDTTVSPLICIFLRVLGRTEAELLTSAPSEEERIPHELNQLMLIIN